MKLSETYENVVLRSSNQSILRYARELGFSSTTVHKVLKKKRLRFTDYKLQLSFDLWLVNNSKRYEFAADIFDEIKANETFLNRVMFSDGTCKTCLRR